MSGRLDTVSGGDPGVTLIELLATLAIITLAATVVLGVLATGTEWNRSAGDQTRATTYATEIVEQLRAAHGNLPALAGQAYSVSRGNWGKLGIDTEGSRNGQAAEVTIQVEDEAVHLYRVGVIIEWGPAGHRHQIRYITLIAGD